MSRIRLTCVLCVLLVMGAFLVSGPAAGAGRRATDSQLRPNLEPLPPGRFVGPMTGLLGATSITSLAPLVIDGCYPEEMARTGARRCLRFDTHILNRGDGPLEVAYVIDGPDVRAMQHIYLESGKYVARRAAASEFHATHTHFHIKDFYVSKLWPAKGGVIVSRRPVSVTNKNGFCPEDSSAHSSGAPPRYGCRSDVRTDNGVSQIVGISAGYMDTYGYALPDQFLEISAVKDGDYVLEIAIDPDDNFLESNERDNRACLSLTLAGDQAVGGRLRRCP